MNLLVGVVVYLVGAGFIAGLTRHDDYEGKGLLAAILWPVLVPVGVVAGLVWVICYLPHKLGQKIGGHGE